MVESKVLCSAAISACESGSQWQVAFEIFRQQEELGLGKSHPIQLFFVGQDCLNWNEMWDRMWLRLPSHDFGYILVHKFLH